MTLLTKKMCGKQGWLPFHHWSIYTQAAWQIHHTALRTAQGHEKCPVAISNELFRLSFWFIKDLFKWVVLFLTDDLTFPANWICCAFRGINSVLTENHFFSPTEPCSVTPTRIVGTQTVRDCVLLKKTPFVCLWLCVSLWVCMCVCVLMGLILES